MVDRGASTFKAIGSPSDDDISVCTVTVVGLLDYCCVFIVTVKVAGKVIKLMFLIMHIIFWLHMMLL